MSAAAWLVCTVALCTGGVPDASAQARPFRPLFGGAAPDAGKDRLDVTVSLAEAYDTSVLTPDGGAGTPGLDVGGYFTALAADLRWAKRGQRAELALNAGTNLRYFQDLQELESVGHFVGAGMSLPVGRRTTVSINEAVSYRPAFLFGLFAKTQAPAIGDVVPVASEYAVNNRESYTSVTSIDVRRMVGRRASIDVSSGYLRTMFAERNSDGPDVTAYHAGGRFSYPLTRNALLRLGYAYRRAEYSGQPRPGQHDIDLGVDYDRPLSRSRRTRLAFGVGSSVMEGPLATRASQQSVRQLRAVGNVVLTHQMGRTWTARAAYRRGAEFIEEFSAPVFTDGATMTLDGFLNRRTDLAMSAAYSSGEALYEEPTSFETYTGTARLRFALTRRLALYGEYVYYYYDLAGAVLIRNIPPRLSRQSARVGVTLWLSGARN